MYKSFSNIALLGFGLLIGKPGQAQYKPIEKESTIAFKIKNLGFTISGFFSSLQGDIRFDPMHLPDAVFDIRIDVNSVNTDNTMRDDHLRNDGFFDTKNFPTMHFVSTKVGNSNKAHTFFIFGKLTIKNITREISFPFTATPADLGWLFKGSFILNRRDFGVGGSGIIADNLEVSLNVLAK
jgi:polyisoprenoid-binding protein YceI